MGGTEGISDQKLRAEIDFSNDKMVSRRIPMTALRADVEILKGVT